MYKENFAKVLSSAQKCLLDEGVKNGLEILKLRNKANKDKNYVRRYKCQGNIPI